MASKDYYSILWVNKSSSEAEIKKAYRKKAMEWHPDKHKWDKKAEDKFKEINEAYQVLWDSKKKAQYDSFWSAWDYSWFSSWWYEWFEDIFKNYSGSSKKYSKQNYDFSDIFSNMFSSSWSWSGKTYSSDPYEWFWSQFSSKTNANTRPKPVEASLDVEKVYEVPIFDLLLGTKLNIETIYNENLKLKIPECTKPWTRFKIKWKWRTSEWKIWDMFVITEAKMPKQIPDDVKSLLESIKYSL